MTHSAVPESARAMIDSLESVQTLFIKKGHGNARANKAKATDAYKAIGNRMPRKRAQEARRKEPLRKAVLPSTAVCARLLAGLSIPMIPLSAVGLRRTDHRKGKFG